MNKLQAIDDVCGQPPGTFNKYVNMLEEAERQKQKQRSERIIAELIRKRNKQ